MGTVTTYGTVVAASTPSYTYSGTPTASNIDRLRFEVSDTGLAGTAGGTVFMFTDNEVTAIVGFETTWPKRIAYACEVLARKWSRVPDFIADGLGVKKSQIAKAYADRAVELRTAPGQVSFEAVDQVRYDGYSHTYTSKEATDESRVTDWDTIGYLKDFEIVVHYLDRS